MSEHFSQPSGEQVSLPGTRSQPLEAVLRVQRVLPVLVLETPAQADWLAGCFLEAGLTQLEVTLRTPQALAVIEHLSRYFPELSVGAGTVLTPDQLGQACDAGARFLIAPGATDTLLQAAQSAAQPFIPGVMTPSEAMRAADYGFTLQKFFPAEAAGGVALLKSMSAPLAGLSFCPTGGIHPGNMADYLQLNNVAAVGGTWLVTPRALANEDRRAVIQALNELQQTG